ncbi:unnamed protein product [marine sediment metagenome]|uniref:Uncharacterized protein n=1 Tax=marine sediment metagenome TaxID=412755 RepID=X1DC17_9ZZZZ
MTTYSQRRVNDYVRAFYWESTLVADELGLELTPGEMGQVKERLVYLWIMEKITDPTIQKLTTAILSEFAEGA